MKGLDIAPPLLRRIHCQRIPPNAKVRNIITLNMNHNLVIAVFL